MGVYVCVICLVKYMCVIYIQDALSDPETLPSLCRRWTCSSAVDCAIMSKQPEDEVGFVGFCMSVSGGVQIYRVSTGEVGGWGRVPFSRI